MKRVIRKQTVFMTLLLLAGMLCIQCGGKQREMPKSKGVEGEEPVTLEQLVEEIHNLSLRDVLKKLLKGEKNVDVNKGDVDDHPLLYWAAELPNPRFAQLLLDHGAKPNLTTPMGDTPLHEAALKGNERVITLLLQRGADKTIKNKEGKTPKDVAKEQGHKGSVDLL
jgi:ankyrin repeat protein